MIDWTKDQHIVVAVENTQAPPKPLRVVTDLGDNECIHCPTEREAEAICKLMHEAGLKWVNGDSYLTLIKWSEYKSQTYYRPKAGKRAEISYATEKGYTIHPASDFLPASFYDEAQPNSDEEGSVKESDFQDLKRLAKKFAIAGLEAGRKQLLFNLEAYTDKLKAERDKALAELADEKFAKLGYQQEFTDLKESFERH